MKSWRLCISMSVTTHLMWYRVVESLDASSCGFVSVSARAVLPDCNDDLGLVGEHLGAEQHHDLCPSAHHMRRPLAPCAISYVQCPHDHDVNVEYIKRQPMSPQALMEGGSHGTFCERSSAEMHVCVGNRSPASQMSMAPMAPRPKAPRTKRRQV
jgi:hypothetical protein